MMRRILHPRTLVLKNRFISLYALKWRLYPATRMYTVKPNEIFYANTPIPVSLLADTMTASRNFENLSAFTDFLKFILKTKKNAASEIQTISDILRPERQYVERNRLMNTLSSLLNVSSGKFRLEMIKEGSLGKAYAKLAKLPKDFPQDANLYTLEELYQLFQELWGSKGATKHVHDVVKRITEGLTTRAEAAFILNIAIKSPHHAKVDNTTYNFTKALTDAICATPKYNQDNFDPKDLYYFMDRAIKESGMNVKEVIEFIKNNGFEEFKKHSFIRPGVRSTLENIHLIKLSKIPEGSFSLEKSLIGRRCQIHVMNNEVKLFGFFREITVIRDIIPWIQEEIASKVESCILDAVVVPLKNISTIIVNSDRDFEAKNVSINDILYLNGKVCNLKKRVNPQSCLDLPYIERRKILIDILKNSERIKVHENEILPSEIPLEEKVDIITKFFEKISKNDIRINGVFLKTLNGKYYDPGTFNPNWKKISLTKPTILEVVPIGAYIHKKKNLLIATYNKETKKFDAIGLVVAQKTNQSIFTKLIQDSLDDKPEEYEVDKKYPDMDVWIKPNYVLKIAAFAIYEAKRDKCGVSISRTTLIEQVEDKSVYDATSTQELLEMVKDSNKNEE